jgi:lactoylglutathione lyase
MKRILAVAALAAGLAACNAEPAKPAEAAAPASPVAEAPPEKDPLMSAVGIGVSDLQKSTDFYINVMGMEKVRTYDSPTLKEEILRYPDGESYLVLMHWTDGVERNYKNLPVKVVTRTKDPVALAAKIKAAGFEITREPVPGDGTAAPVAGFAKDPDGYDLELLPPRAPAPPATPVAPAPN